MKPCVTNNPEEDEAAPPPLPSLMEEACESVVVSDEVETEDPYGPKPSPSSSEEDTCDCAIEAEDGRLPRSRAAFDVEVKDLDDLREEMEGAIEDLCRCIIGRFCALLLLLPPPKMAEMPENTPERLGLPSSDSDSESTAASAAAFLLEDRRAIFGLPSERLSVFVLLDVVEFMLDRLDEMLLREDMLFLLLFMRSSNSEDSRVFSR